MVRRLNLSDRTASIPSAFLSLVRNFLTDSFSLPGNAFSDVAYIMKEIRRFILTAADELLVPLVVEIQDSLSLWISNAHKLTPPDDYNAVVSSYSLATSPLR